MSDTKKGMRSKRTSGQVSAKNAAGLSPSLCDQSSRPTGAPLDGAFDRAPQLPPKKVQHDMSSELPSLVECFRKWLHLPDPGVLLVTLGAVAANYMKGDPIWLLLIGPPSSGKTEILQSFIQLPKVFPVSVLTEASLLSGTKMTERAKNAKGGLLKEIGDFGIVVFKDFTSVLSMNRDSRQSVLAALREIYDGHWTRIVGTDGGTRLAWKGKIALVAGCTPMIDSLHSVISVMGERFVYYRLPEGEDEDVAEQARRAIRNSSQPSEMRAELVSAVCEFFSRLESVEQTPKHSELDVERLIDLAMLTCRARSPVERDPVQRFVTLAPQPEAPARLAGVLRRLGVGLRRIGISETDVWQLIAKVALDSIPSPRRELVEVLARKPENSLEVATLASKVRCSKTAVRRALEDLELHGLVVADPGVGTDARYWSLSQWAQQRLTALGNCFSEMSVNAGIAE